MDVVVTCPKTRWHEWLAEGGLPGETVLNGTAYYWFGRGSVPRIAVGELVYVVAHGHLRGYAPLVRIEYRGNRPPSWWWPEADWALVREGGAVACTIAQSIRGFPGVRYRGWDRSDEIAFPGWKQEGVSS